MPQNPYQHDPNCVCCDRIAELGTILMAILMSGPREAFADPSYGAVRRFVESLPKRTLPFEPTADDMDEEGIITGRPMVVGDRSPDEAEV